MALLSLEKVRKVYDGRVLFEDLDFALDAGERVGLVGLNGCGKSTLLRLLAGVEVPDAGRRVLRRDLRLGYLEQEPTLPDAPVREAVRTGFTGREATVAELAQVHATLARATGTELERLLARQARLEGELERQGGHDVEHRIEALLQGLGVSAFDAACATLSGGERRRVALARLLASAPELLLLDEPTNHLDAFVIDWLEDWFLETRTPLLLVTHDRYFLDRVCDRIVELDRGTLTSTAGGYAEYLEARAARLHAEARAEGARLNLLRRETAWMRRGPPARTTKAKARIRRYDELVSDAPVPLSDELEILVPPGPRLGARVVQLEGIEVSLGDRRLFSGLDLELSAGDRLGIVGPNGAGKTTLLRVLLGERAPDAGRLEVGSTVRFAHMDQLRSDLDLDVPVVEALAGRRETIAVGERSVRVESYLDRFGLGAAHQRAQVRALSGGERSRLQLAKLLCRGGNVLVLDEPTNDLDLTTLRALEESLVAFPGCLVLVSHDRWFLDRVATRILHLDGQGSARIHHGDMSSLLEVLARGRSARGPMAPVARRAEAARAPVRARRITPWQLEELTRIEGEIGALEARIAALDQRLGDPGLYVGAAPAVVGVRAEREGLAADLAALYARWEELEALRSPPPA